MDKTFCDIWESGSPDSQGGPGENLIHPLSRLKLIHNMSMHLRKSLFREVSIVCGVVSKVSAC